MTRNLIDLVFKVTYMNQDQVIINDNNCILKIKNFVKSKNKIKESKITLSKRQLIKTHKNSLRFKTILQKIFLLDFFLLKVRLKKNFIINYISIALGMIVMVLAGELEISNTTSMILFTIAFSSFIFGGLYNNEISYLQVNEKKLNKKTN